MDKGIRNLIIGGTIATLLTAGYILKKEPAKDIIVDEDSIRIERAITYNDGSTRYLMHFPEEYGIDNSDYVEANEDEIDYIEYFNEDGSKTVVDYPIKKLK